MTKDDVIGKACRVFTISLQSGDITAGAVMIDLHKKQPGGVPIIIPKRMDIVQVEQYGTRHRLVPKRKATTDETILVVFQGSGSILTFFPMITGDLDFIVQMGGAVGKASVEEHLAIVSKDAEFRLVWRKLDGMPTYRYKWNGEKIARTILEAEASHQAD